MIVVRPMPITVKFEKMEKMGFSDLDKIKYQPRKLSMTMMDLNILRKIQNTPNMIMECERKNQMESMTSQLKTKIKQKLINVKSYW